jgi:hypothetical protein
MSSPKRFRCEVCSVHWTIGADEKAASAKLEYRYCPSCGGAKVQEHPFFGGFVHDGGGPRSASPVESPQESSETSSTLPPVRSLVFVRTSVTEDYWILDTVIEHMGRQGPDFHLAFETQSHCRFWASDLNKTWKPAPSEYMAFLSSWNLSFEDFAMALARGGLERLANRSMEPLVADWGAHNASRYRGVAQEALRLLTKPLVDAEHKRLLAHTEMRRLMEVVQEAQKSTGFDKEEYLGRWLKNHFPEVTVSAGKSLEKSMELLMAMQCRLEAISLLSGNPTKTEAWTMKGRVISADEELASLLRQG